MTDGSAHPLGVITRLDDVVVESGAMANVCSGWGIPPTLVSNRTVTPERYHPHYRLPLGPACGSDVAAPDWSI
jgi:hypothetical protein